MSEAADQEFLSYLAAQTGLPASVCHRLVLDILSEYSESLDAFVQRRHQELRATGEFRNEQIYAQILTEIPSRRFSAPQLTTRQVRRLIYG